MKFSKETIKKILIAVFVSVIVLIIVYYRFHIYYQFLSWFTPKSVNTDNNEKMKTLHPVFRIRVGKFIKELESMGKKVTITSAGRTPEEQQQLYNSGQTPAPPFSSYHNFGMAIDLNVDNLKMASSKSDWQQVADIGKSYGFRWGGDFKDSWDKVHFDDGNKYDISSLKDIYNSGAVVNKQFVKVF